jgi:hypothetical protein
MVLSALVIGAVRMGKVQPDDHRERPFKEHSLLGSGPIQANRRDSRGTLESGRRIWKSKLCLEPCDLMYIVRSDFGASPSGADAPACDRKLIRQRPFSGGDGQALLAPFRPYPAATRMAQTGGQRTIAPCEHGGSCWSVRSCPAPDPALVD